MMIFEEISILYPWTLKQFKNLFVKESLKHRRRQSIELPRFFHTPQIQHKISEPQIWKTVQCIVKVHNTEAQPDIDHSEINTTQIKNFISMDKGDERLLCMWKEP